MSDTEIFWGYVSGREQLA